MTKDNESDGQDRPTPPNGYRIAGRRVPKAGEKVVGIFGSVVTVNEVMVEAGRLYWILEPKTDGIPAPDYDPDDVAFTEEFKKQLISCNPVDGVAFGAKWFNYDCTTEPSGNSGQLPRLVPVERDLPTLDQMPEGEPHRCYESVAKPKETNQLVLARHRHSACEVDGSGNLGSLPVGPASSYTVLDAEPKQQTVGDLRPGDVFEWDGGLWLLITRKWAGWNCACVPLDPGEEDRGNTIKFPRRDTPISQVYRFEV